MRHRNFLVLFLGGKKKLSNLILKLKEENKKRKRNAHKAHMKQCGGKGKERNIPPPEYVPDCFVNKKTCNICGEGYDTNSELRDHAQNIHRMFITKSWSKDALF